MIDANNAMNMDWMNPTTHMLAGLERESLEQIETEFLRDNRMDSLQAENERLRAELDEVTGAAFFHGDTHIEIAHCDDGTLVTRFCQRNQHEDFLRTDGSWVKYVGGSTHFKSYRAARDAFNKWKENSDADSAIER